MLRQHQMSRMHNVAMVIGIGLLAGFLIGGVGIGGVIVAPALAYLFNIEIRFAIAAALMSFAFSGLVGTLRYGKLGSIRWRAAAILSAAAIPASIAGTALTHRVSPPLLKCLLGVVVLSSGLHAIFGRTRFEAACAGPVSTRRLATIGAVTGFGSVLTGTGGPVLLIPILLWQQQPVLMAIGLSQVIQLPISLVATAMNLAVGGVDVRLGAILAIALGVGCWFGVSVAHRLPADALRSGVSYLLVVVGVAIVADVAANSLL
jgi:uncharacterized membrane protein YfcA